MCCPVREFIYQHFFAQSYFYKDLAFLFCKIQGFMVAKRSFHMWHEEGDGFWHHAEKLSYKSWY